MTGPGEEGPSAGKRVGLPVSEAVAIPVGRVVLGGHLEVPQGARGLVLFAHGSGSSRHSPRNQFVARVLRDAANGTLLFDLLTQGEEKEDAVTGHLRFDIRFLAERLEAATHWAAHHAAARRLPIGYFGSSTGGAAALVAAATLRSIVDAVVSRGGRPDLAEDSLPLVSAPTLLIVGEYRRDGAASQRGRICENEMPEGARGRPACDTPIRGARRTRRSGAPRRRLVSEIFYATSMRRLEPKPITVSSRVPDEVEETSRGVAWC